MSNINPVLYALFFAIGALSGRALSLLPGCNSAFSGGILPKEFRWAGKQYNTWRQME